MTPRHIEQIKQDVAMARLLSSDRFWRVVDVDGSACEAWEAVRVRAVYRKLTEQQGS